jgi:hypothetical protein
MAFGADRVLIDRGPNIVIAKRAVRIVAIGALDQALIDLVMKGHIEAWFDIGVALEAESWLADFEQCSLWSRLMHRVATDAAHIRLCMRGAKKVGMSTCVASETCSIYGLGVSSRKIQNLGLVTARLYVSLPCTMTAFAGHALAIML